MSADERRARVLLVGLGATSLSALDGLAASFDVCALIRDGHDATTERARELGVRVVSDVTVGGVRAAVAELEPDAVVVSSFNRILDAELVSRCPFINVHYAPLPRGRGRATVNWAIINGDETAAISIHHLVPGLDAGGILFQQTVPIGPDSTVATLYDELDDLQRQHIAAATAAAIAGDPGVEQDELQATYLCTRVPDDGEVDWSAATTEIHRLVRALQPPFPSAFTWLGLDQVHLDEVSRIEGAPTYEGRVPGRGRSRRPLDRGGRRAHRRWRASRAAGTPPGRRADRCGVGGVVGAHDARAADGRPGRGDSVAADERRRPDTRRITDGASTRRRRIHSSPGIDSSPGHRAARSEVHAMISS